MFAEFLDDIGEVGADIFDAPGVDVRDAIPNAVVTLADFATLRWLGLCEALRGATQMKAVGRAFGRLFGVAWLALVASLLIAVQYKREQDAAAVFACWFAACLVYDLLLVRRCRRWLAPGFRRRATEGTTALASSPIARSGRRS